MELHGIEVENANGPAAIGQYISMLLFVDGRGEGGRIAEQKYVLFVHASNVSVDIVVNSVARRKSIRQNCRLYYDER